MANEIQIYEGFSQFEPGNTPFGFYDNDLDFQRDADLVVKFCARRLGYPIIDIELQDINFYAAFEEAITSYGNELYSYQIRDNQLGYQGMPIGVSQDFNESITYPSLSYIIKISQNYGAEADVGGNVPSYKGKITLTGEKQSYDLKLWAEENNIEKGDLEIRRVFYEAPPSLSRFSDPMAASTSGMLDTFGFGGMSPATSFLMMPLSSDLMKLQSVELNEQIRRLNYSFRLVNNVLEIFPIPQRDGGLIWFEYIKPSERLSSSIVNLDRDVVTGEYTDTRYPNGWVSNVSNVPYKNPTYSKINSVGRSWIFDYSLAICKEILGFIRGKYSTIPIPNDQVTLNYGDLVGQGQREKEELKRSLREYFDQTSRQSLLTRRSAESDIMNKELNNIPYSMIYVG